MVRPAKPAARTSYLLYFFNMNIRQLAITAGVSYLVIFFTAIYANFFVLDALLNDPLGTVAGSSQHIRFGALAFLIAAVFDVIVAWALYEMYREHFLSRLSTYFRLMHATIMGVGVFALVPIVALTTSDAILAQVDIFNTIWLIGLFCFGFHLILLSRIVREIRFIPYMLMLAGVMYIVDTSLQFTLPSYDLYADTFLMMVAIPAILGEMSFSLWLLYKGGKDTVTI